MKKNFLLLGVLFLVVPLFSQKSVEFKRVDQWQHDDIFNRNIYSIINPENQLVGGFSMVGNRIITKEKVIQFALRGQAPNELEHFQTAFIYKGDLAVLELPEKLKVFTKKGESYVWKETKWLKRGKWNQYFRDGIFFDNKFFFAGYQGFGANSKIQEITFLKVYDEKGTSLKQLIRKTFPKANHFIDLNYFVSGYKSDRVFFMAANELKLFVISSKTLEIIKEVSLAQPTFYKKMPADYYLEDTKKRVNWKTWTPEQSKGIVQKMEEWETSYSSIQEMVVDGNYLVVQIRTADPNQKKFALLYYNVENFKLEKTVFINDYLLDFKDGKYYFFGNGNPGRDDDTDECIINIYSWQSKAK